MGVVNRDSSPLSVLGAETGMTKSSPVPSPSCPDHTQLGPLPGRPFGTQAAPETARVLDTSPRGACATPWGHSGAMRVGTADEVP